VRVPRPGWALSLSNRLRWRVIAGLTAVGIVAVAGVAGVSYVLAARAERATARQVAAAESGVIARALQERGDAPARLDDVLAPAAGVDGAVLDADGDVVAATGELVGDAALPSPVAAPTAADVVAAQVDGVDVLATSTALPDGGRLVLVFDQAATREAIVALRWSVVAAALAVSVLLVVLMAVVTRRILDPVERTARAARHLARGALGTRLGDDVPHLFADLTGAFDEMAAALQQTVDGLRAMEGRQRRFVADVSHELRTPLQALSTASDLLEPAIPGLDGPARRAAEALVDETRRLRHLVEDLMEISRLDATAGQEVPREPVVLDALVRRTLGHRGWADRVHVDVPEDLVLASDPRRLDTILANLVGNALTHGAPPVEVRAAAGPPGRVTVEVVDHGPGVPVPDRDRVFERFAKADRARTREHGSGLGLAIARDHATALGATLELTCPDTGGAVLRLVHPVDGRAPRGEADVSPPPRASR
jgi:two-component system sensor histidine kinase MtrB